MQYAFTRWSAVLVLLLISVLATACGEDEEPATNLDRVELRLLEPAAEDTVAVVDGLVDYRWVYSERPDGQFSYTIQVSSSPDFSSRETITGTLNGYQNGHLSTTRFRTRPYVRPDQPDPEALYWRMRLSTGSAMVTPWTETHRFFIAQ